MQAIQKIIPSSFACFFYFSSRVEKRSCLSLLFYYDLLNTTYGYIRVFFFFKDRDRSSENYGATGITGKIVVNRLSCHAIASGPRYIWRAWLRLGLILAGRVPRCTPVRRDRRKSTCRSLGPLSAKCSFERIIARFNLGHASAAPDIGTRASHKARTVRCTYHVYAVT